MSTTLTLMRQASSSGTITARAFDDAGTAVAAASGVNGTHPNFWVTRSDLGLADSDSGRVEWYDDGSLIAHEEIHPQLGSTDFIANAVTAELNPSMGALPFIVSVVDDTDSIPIPGATVRMSRAGKWGVETSDAAGDAPFSVDAETWAITVDAAGYETRATTHTVAAADESIEIRLTSITLPAAEDPDLCRCRLTVVGHNGQLLDGAKLITRVDPVTFHGNALVHFAPAEAESVQGLISVDLLRETKFHARVTYGDSPSISFAFVTPAASEAFIKTLVL